MDTSDLEQSVLRKLPLPFEVLSFKLSLTSFQFEEDIGETRSELLTLSLKRLLESADQFEFDSYPLLEELESFLLEHLRRFFNMLVLKTFSLHLRDLLRLLETPSRLHSMPSLSHMDSLLQTSGRLPPLEELPSKSTRTSSSLLARTRTTRRARRNSFKNVIDQYKITL